MTYESVSCYNYGNSYSGENLRAKLGTDLIVIGIVSLLLIPLVIFSPSVILRIIFGLPFILFFPGYSLTAALFPGKGRLSTIERVAYSIALSIALVAIIGLILNFVWSITLYPMLTVLEVFVFAMIAVAGYRRHQLPDEEKINFMVRMNLSWSRIKLLNWVLYVILALAVIGAIVTSVYTYNKNSQTFSEFYLLGQGGKAEGYPQQLSVGQEGQISLVIVNRERADTTYMVKVLQDSGKAFIDGVEKTEFNLPLKDGQKKSYEVKFVFDKTGSGQKLEFDLFKSDSTAPYLQTYLKVEVTQ
jgi:uncharacterized membrane protein